MEREREAFPLRSLPSNSGSHSPSLKGRGGPKKFAAKEARRPKQNKPEGAAFDRLRALGFQPSKRGWPDFVAFSESQMVAVEVKPDHEPFLKASQANVLGYLAKHGIPVYLFTPSGGFEPLFGSPPLETP